MRPSLTFGPRCLPLPLPLLCCHARPTLTLPCLFLYIHIRSRASLVRSLAWPADSPLSCLSLPCSPDIPLPLPPPYILPSHPSLLRRLFCLFLRASVCRFLASPSLQAEAFACETGYGHCFAANGGASVSRSPPGKRTPTSVVAWAWAEQ